MPEIEGLKASAERKHTLNQLMLDVVYSNGGPRSWKSLAYATEIREQVGEKAYDDFLQALLSNSDAVSLWAEDNRCSN